MFSLKGQKALVVGMANDSSIACGCAKAFRQQGADLAITYLNETAEGYVRPLAEELGAAVIAPLDVQHDDQLDAVFRSIKERWGKLDILLHSIAFCPKDDLHGRVIDCSRAGFGLAMDVSVHSFLRMIRQAEPLMPDGGTCMTVSFYGSEKAVDYYNIMGPGQGSIGIGNALRRGRVGQQGHIRACALAWTAKDTRCKRHRSF